MLYKTYCEQGLFYGSGVIEGGCKSGIGQRLKEPEMFWTETGATSILNLRLALKKQPVRRMLGAPQQFQLSQSQTRRLSKVTLRPRTQQA